MPELIIINGSEEFLKERAVETEIQTRLIKNISKYDYDDLEKYDEDRCSPMLFGGTRAFVINNCKKIPELPHDSDILITVSGTKKLSDKRASVVHEFNALKTYANNNDVIKWIIKEGTTFNIDLSRVAGPLFMNSGKSLRKLHSEIKKLSIVTSPGTQVTPEIAKTLLCFSAELTPKEIVDSVCEGNTGKALAYYDKLQAMNDETGWIIAYMQRHLIQTLKIELMRERKLKSDNISEILGIHPYVYKQSFEPRIGLWSIDSLRIGLENMCDLDLAHKRGDSSSDFGLEIELIRLSEEAKNGRQRN